jgi:hypothetical protein
LFRIVLKLFCIANSFSVQLWAQFFRMRSEESIL